MALRIEVTAGNVGMLEYWVAEKRIVDYYPIPIIPLIHYSIIPVVSPGC
jgi:hypothetical protein